ncbi:hypothetical protein BLNAU_1617 [Blattamonas nauphoetae]|uniref:Uncharacterized protein n=1 Tax=Blattamonas nauphoetae TaxID=2049346 RepID=A0ABQ9YIZ7_9EUKA|nr:hypothetical protein BLNAU_1617 [Blattamonas nauphoetae]
MSEGGTLGELTHDDVHGVENDDGEHEDEDKNDRQFSSDTPVSPLSIPPSFVHLPSENTSLHIAAGDHRLRYDAYSLSVTFSVSVF